MHMESEKLSGSKVWKKTQKSSDCFCCCSQQTNLSHHKPQKTQHNMASKGSFWTSHNGFISLAWSVCFYLDATLDDSWPPPGRLSSVWSKLERTISLRTSLSRRMHLRTVELGIWDRMLPKWRILRRTQEKSQNESFVRELPVFQEGQFLGPREL